MLTNAALQVEFWFAMNDQETELDVVTGELMFPTVSVGAVGIVTVATSE